MAFSWDSFFCFIPGTTASLSLWFLFDWYDEALGLNCSDFVFVLFAFIMGPGCSSSLRIGDDSSAVASSGQTRGASDRSAAVELRNAPRALPLPLDKGKRRISLIK